MGAYARTYEDVKLVIANCHIWRSSSIASMRMRYDCMNQHLAHLCLIPIIRCCHSKCISMHQRAAVAMGLSSSLWCRPFCPSLRLKFFDRKRSRLSQLRRGHAHLGHIAEDFPLRNREATFGGHICNLNLRVDVKREHGLVFHDVAQEIFINPLSTRCMTEAWNATFLGF